MTESFILGLSSGSACLITCGIVMFPYMMAGSAGVKSISRDISVFLLGRMIVYFILATLSWHFGRMFLNSPGIRNNISGILFIAFAVMLIWYSITKNRSGDCPASQITRLEGSRIIPLFSGILNGLAFCPALLIVITSSATKTSLISSYLCFMAFFAGSSLWFIPLPFAGRIKKKKILKTVGILATGLAGLIYIIKGISILIGGLIYD